jgi:hypothetical protein
MEIYTGGWIDDREAVVEIASQLETPLFGDTEAANISEKDLPKNVLLWRCVKEATGMDKLPVRQQGKVGSCVGHGTCRAIEYTNIIEICQGDQEEFKFLSRILSYQGGRVVVGNNRFKGRQGSLGVFSAQFAHSYGNLDEDSKLIDYSYSDEKCKNMQDNPVPSVILDFIKDYKVSNITSVRNWVECKKALSQGYGISVSSKVGFTKNRLPNGICKRDSNWFHCTALIGYMTINNDEYGVIENSWGDYMGQDNPVPENANNGCFLAHSSDMGVMLDQSDSWAFAGLNGFKKRKIDWRF